MSALGDAVGARLAQQDRAQVRCDGGAQRLQAPLGVVAADRLHAQLDDAHGPVAQLAHDIDALDAVAGDHAAAARQQPLLDHQRTVL